MALHRQARPPGDSLVLDRLRRRAAELDRHTILTIQMTPDGWTINFTVPATDTEGVVDGPAHGRTFAEAAEVALGVWPRPEGSRR